MKLKQTIILGLIGIAVGLAILSVTPASALTCGGASTSIISCPEGDGSGGLEKSGVWAILLLILNIMTAGVGILAVGGIVYGAVLYTTATDKAEQTKKAIGIITNVVIGIVAYGLMFLVLNFLIPGGLFTA